MVDGSGPSPMSPPPAPTRGGPDPNVAPKVKIGLSARLLVLTIVFLMIAEFLIWAPSVARFRKAWLEDHLVRAHLAMLAFGALPDPAASHGLERELLAQTESHGIVLKRPDRRVLMVVDDMPPQTDLMVDLNEESMLVWVHDGLRALFQDHNRVLRVVGTPPLDPDVTIEVVLDETPMRKAMYGYSWRIFSLSIVISLFTAGLLYFTLQWMMVRPIRRITASMIAFRADPEGPAVTLPDTARRDEIGIAQRELKAMQEELRAALAQKSRLATLGAAVAKVNHDLRNTLAKAMLVSDRLADIDDPEVQRVTPRLYEAMDRAVALCSATLNFVSDVRPALDVSRFGLKGLLDEVGSALVGVEMAVEADAATPAPLWIVDIDPAVAIEGDREQLFRVFFNLGQNAIQAGARAVRIAAAASDGRVRVTVKDDAAGLPPRAQERLFQPFVGSARRGGTGLGLPIARDIVRAHGGTIALVETGPAGTTFAIELPTRPPAAA